MIARIQRALLVIAKGNDETAVSDTPGIALYKFCPADIEAPVF